MKKILSIFAFAMMAVCSTTFVSCSSDSKDDITGDDSSTEGTAAVELACEIKTTSADNTATGSAVMAELTELCKKAVGDELNTISASKVDSFVVMMTLDKSKLADVKKKLESINSSEFDNIKNKYSDIIFMKVRCMEPLVGSKTIYTTNESYTTMPSGTWTMKDDPTCTITISETGSNGYYPVTMTYKGETYTDKAKLSHGNIIFTVNNEKSVTLEFTKDSPEKYTCSIMNYADESYILQNAEFDKTK